MNKLEAEVALRHPALFAKDALGHGSDSKGGPKLDWWAPVGTMGVKSSAEANTSHGKYILGKADSLHRQTLHYQSHTPGSERQYMGLHRSFGSASKKAEEHHAKMSGN